MKNKHEINIVPKWLFILTIVSIILFAITIILLIANITPSFNGNIAVQNVYFSAMLMLCIFSGIISLTMGEMLIIGLVKQANFRKKHTKSIEFVNNTLSTKYIPVNLCNISALHHIINDVVDVADVISEAKISNGKVAVKMHIDIETEIFVDQFKDNFEIKN